MSKVFDIDKYVRRLAKGNRYQSLFSLSKEMKTKLLDNDTDYTSIQLLFISYIAMYNNLYSDIALSEVNEIVLENDIYVDAYNYYKSKNKGLKKEEPQRRIPANREEIVGRKSQWIFKNPKK